MANIFEFLSKDGNITPEKARKSRQMHFRDKTAYVWGRCYRWDPSLLMNPVCRFAHFMPTCHTPRKLPQHVSQTLWNGSKLWYQVVHSRNCINHTWPGVICIYQGRFDTIRQKLICIYQRPHWALHQPEGGACSWRLRYKEIMVMREPVRRWWLVDHSPLGCILTPITPNFVSFAEKLICCGEQQV